MHPSDEPAMTRRRSITATALATEYAAELADLFKLLGDATRLRIVLTCLDAPVSVNEIADRLDLSPSLVSHHLRLLRAADIVRGARHGKQVFYAAADEHVRCVVADMLEHVAEPRDEP